MTDKTEDAPSRVLLAVEAGTGLWLASAGHLGEYVESEYNLAEFTELINCEPGIWVAELSSDGRWTWEGEYEEEVELLNLRRATAAEIRDHAKDEIPWDPDLWPDWNADRIARMEREANR